MDLNLAVLARAPDPTALRAGDALPWSYPSLMTDAARLPYGYSNESWADDTSVWKRYVGFQAAARMRSELSAIEATQGIVPVPQVLSVDFDDSIVRFARVLGVPGQKLVESGHGEAVMLAAGRTLAKLQGALRGEITHGDYGPHNLLLDARASEVVLVADWEFAEANGQLVADLAWAEWIVRMHHPDQVTSIAHLFVGYGTRPPWDERLSAMIEKCAWFSARAQQAGRPSAHRLWEQRRALTSTWVEVGDR